MQGKAHPSGILVQLQLWNDSRGTSSSGQGCTAAQGCARSPGGIPADTTFGVMQLMGFCASHPSVAERISPGRKLTAAFGWKCSRFSWKGTNETVEMEELEGKAEVQ